MLLVNVAKGNSEPNRFFDQLNVTVNMKSVELSVVLKEIEEQTGLSFFFSNEKLDVKKIVSLNVTNEPLESVLSKLFGNDYSFSRKDNYIVVNKKKLAPQEPKLVRRKIEGTVTGEDGAPIPGVSVVVKGTYIGVATNAIGKFILEYKSDAAPVLQFSCVGYVKQDVNFEGKQILNVQMKSDKIALDETIVTGYANIKKKDFTGSAITVKRDELLKSSPKNVIETLQLFDPSFKIIENNEMGSNPNSMPEIYVRGRSGLGNTEITQSGNLSEQNLRNNPNLPTFIMDGFEIDVERLYDLDPTRVE